MSGVKTKTRSVRRRTPSSRSRSIVKAKRIKLAGKISVSKTVPGKVRVKKIAGSIPLEPKPEGWRTTSAQAAGSIGEPNALKTLANVRGLDTVAAAIERAQTVGGSVRFTVDVTLKGQAAISAVEPIAAAPLSDAHSALRSELDRSLVAARDRGRHRVAEILSRKDMLSADEMARLLGATRMTVNTKRRNHLLLGLEGAKRGYRFPQWQIAEDGKPFEALPALFDRLGGSPWAVYRFLVQRQPELGGLTGREALAKGRSAQAIEAAESVANAFS